MAQNMDVRTFVETYLDAEHDLWVRAHTERNDEAFFAAAEAFDATFFGPELYSVISRPGHMDDERFLAFRALLTDKQRRLLFCLREDEGVSLAVLGSVMRGSTGPFELIRIRDLNGEPKIVSSYLTNFDGTFSWSGGENVGEVLPDPC